MQQQLKECKFGLNCLDGINCKYQHTNEQKLQFYERMYKSNTQISESDRKRSLQKSSGNQKYRQNGPQRNIKSLTVSQISTKDQNINNTQEVEEQKSDHQEKQSEFVYYREGQNCQNDIPENQKCHWYDIFGKCDLKRCDKSHQFKPLFKCVFASVNQKCQRKMPKYTLKSNYDCNKQQNIINCHRYTVNGFCNTKICSYLHKQILGKCDEFQCKFCKTNNEENQNLSKTWAPPTIKENDQDFQKNRDSEIKKKNKDKNQQQKNIQKKQPEFIYYKDGQNCEEKIPQTQKCHWYDIFGKCDINQCQLNHNFKPQYECCYIKSGEKCSCKYPKYTLWRKYDCNNNEQPKKCHDYNLEGICNNLVCPYIHKEILRKCEVPNCKLCQQKREKIIKEIESMQNTLKSKFQYNPNKLKQVCSDMQKIISNQIVQIKFQETFDLMFIVDCTSSMQPWIDFVKQSIRNIIDQIKKTYSTFSFRYSFVGYRDFGDDKVVNFDFNPNLDNFIKHVDTIKAIGGGDIPEDMASGLKEGLKQNFRSYVKAVFLIYDAPNHGLQYHDGDLIDNYKHLGTNIEPLIQNYAESNIYFTSIMLKSGGRHIAQKTLEAIESEYKRCNKTNKFYQIKAEKDPNFQIQQFIQTTIETTIKHSKLNQSSLSVKKIDNPIFKQLEFGKSYQIKPVNQYIRHFDFPIQWDNLFIIVEESSYEYEIQLQNQFKDGTQRRAYNGKDETLNRDIVVKFDLRINQNESLYEQMKDQQESQVVSSYIVNKFRNLVIPYVQNLQSLPYYIGANIAKLPKLNNFCYTEVLLSEFDKFSNNAEYQKEAKTENEQLLECLPHFSFQYSEGYLMITDLQGHGSILTDPCVHTLDNRKYGSTNLGQLGMSKYFAKHKCNKFCEKLKLIHPSDTQSVEKFDCDYIKQVEENSDSRLQTLKHITEIQKYKNINLFCEVCEHYEKKNTEINSEKSNDLKYFAKDFCIECRNKVKLDKEKIQCSECFMDFPVQKYWIKMKKGNMNGKCTLCNKRNYLKDLSKFYLGEIPQPSQI
ncbi:hypothetical protein ABPG74_007625 [Tetrahymena malaccensis]